MVPHSGLVKDKPLKRFGQHFLASPAIAQRIVEAAGIDRSDTVLEIGPGRGILTDLMIERSGNLVAVELDRHLARELASRYHGRPNVRIVQADFLEVDPLCLGLSNDGKNLAVSNLPYNAAVPIIEKLLAMPATGSSGPAPFAKMVLMVQREVAVRMAANPGTKEYGSLSVFVQVRARVERLFDVKPGSFVPPPKVMSTVVELIPREKPLVTPDEAEAFHCFVRACFGYRRKALGAGLRQALGAGREAVERIAKDAGVDLVRRAEHLTVNEFLALYRSTKSI